MMHARLLGVFTSLCLGLLAAGPSRGVEPWATYRGNPQRTGHTDGNPGPTTPKVLWAFKSKDHYVSSPVPGENRLFLSGLGAFNVASFSCLSTEGAAEPRVLWAKTSPYLKLP